MAYFLTLFLTGSQRILRALDKGYINLLSIFTIAATIELKLTLLFLGQKNGMPIKSCMYNIYDNQI